MTVHDCARNVVMLGLCGLSCILMPRDVQAVPDRTWNGSVSDDWFVADNWTPADNWPQAAEVVAVTNGSVLLTNVTHDLASFTIVNATLTFSNWTSALRADTIDVLADATVTLPPPFAESQMSNRVYFVCSNFYLAADALIDAVGRGYDRQYRGDGYGEGGGRQGGSTHGSGAGYGGAGGVSGSTPGGVTYGRDHYPCDPGSAGGEGSGASGVNMAGAGGGAVLIDAPQGSVVIDGEIDVSGISTAGRGGGGAGGSILIVCGALSGGPAGHLLARGGNINDVQWGGPGAGGRIAVLMGISALDRAALSEGASVDGLRVRTNVSRPSVALEPGVDLLEDAKSAEAGTWRLLSVETPGFFDVEISGTPMAYGDPGSRSYGVHVGIPVGTSITNGVVAPAVEVDGRRWTCVGWDLFDVDGNPVQSGGSTQAVFTVTTNLSLVWHWTNEYYLAVDSLPNGAATGQGWYTNGASGVIEAHANAGYDFLQWDGDIALDQRHLAQTALLMDRPRTVTAAFASSAGEQKTWNGGTGEWIADDRWTPPGIPGRRDAVVIATGTVVLATPQYAASLHVGELATVVFTNWLTFLNVDDVQVDGILTLPPAFVALPPIYTEIQMSNRIHVVCRDFTLAQGAMIDVAGRGFGRKTGTGRGTGGGNTTGGGGGYGGRGGDSGAGGTGGLPYGSELLPIDPGSGGGEGGTTVGAGEGGGVAWIDASGRVVIDGVIDASGIDSPNRSGGGSGGSILITCRSFMGQPSGALLADGGDCGATDYGGAGGGGRIAVWLVPASQSRQLYLDGFGVGVTEMHQQPGRFSGSVSASQGTGGVYGAAPHPQGAWPGSIRFFVQRGTLFLFR